MSEEAICVLRADLIERCTTYGLEQRISCPGPEPPLRRLVGRSHRHGKEFDCKDSKTRPNPTREHLCQNEDHGVVRVRAWSGLHPKTRRARKRCRNESSAVVRGTVVLVEVERLPRGERRLKSKALWLGWNGTNEPDLDLLWKAYCRRFDVEHAIRYSKEGLGWVRPKVRHPEQLDRCTCLVLRPTLSCAWLEPRLPTVDCLGNVVIPRIG